MRRLLIGITISFLCSAPVSSQQPLPELTEQYRISAVKIAEDKGAPRANFFYIANKDSVATDTSLTEGVTDVVSMFIVLQNKERTILFDAGFFREKSWQKRGIRPTNFLRPDQAIRELDIAPEDVTDVIMSHIHFAHMQGGFLFPNATFWMHKQEYDYYVGKAWQRPLAKEMNQLSEDDIVALVEANVNGRLHLIEEEGAEILPGIRVFKGGKHSVAPLFALVEGSPRVVLASDNAYFYEHIEKLIPAGNALTHQANLRAIKRMASMVDDPRYVIPGHEPAVFTRFPSRGRIATIRP